MDITNCITTHELEITTLAILTTQGEQLLHFLGSDLMHIHPMLAVDRRDSAVLLQAVSICRQLDETCGTPNNGEQKNYTSVR